MGCLSSIVRRLVCNKSEIHGGSAEENAPPGPKPEHKAKLASPGIVARLMGLESMPVFPYTPPPNSITRSRSTGSLDSLPAFLSGERRIPSSVSFREEPTYLRPENDDFLLLTFYPDDQFESFQAKKRSKTERSEARESMQPYRENNKLKKAEDCAKPIKSKLKKKRKNKKRSLAKKDQSKLELECASENSSPDSVLDDPFNFIPIPDESDDKLRSSRRKLASELETLKCSSPMIEFVAFKDDGGLKLHYEDTSKPNKDQTRQVWECVCKLADEEAEKSNWISGKWEEGEVAVITGIEILDFLLNEVVQELYFN